MLSLFMRSQSTRNLNIITQSTNSFNYPTTVWNNCYSILWQCRFMLTLKYLWEIDH
jgi:hypothetical protein